MKKIEKTVQAGPHTQEPIFDPQDAFVAGVADTPQPSPEPVVGKKRPRKKDFYNIANITREFFHYRLVFGERSNGKSFGVQLRMLEKFVENGKVSALIRRWSDDITAKNMQDVWAHLECDAYGVNQVEKISKGQYNTIIYKAGKWFLAKREEGLDDVICPRAFCTVYALNIAERYKSTAGIPDLGMVVFEEFITRRAYLNGEFVEFCNLLSTLIRRRDDVEVWLIGNTVNPYCPYFAEMGLRNVRKMKPGDLDIYKNAATGQKIAVEYADGPSDGKPSDVYFAFDNPKLQMITQGSWELEIYPHCPKDGYRKDDIVHSYFISFDGEMLQADIVSQPGKMWTFVHRKTSPLKDENRDVIYSTTVDPRPNWKTRFSSTSKHDKKILWFYQNNKVFYQDNECGELMRNFILNATK